MRTRCSLVATVAFLVPFTGLAQNLPWRASLRLANVNVKSSLGTFADSGTTLSADADLGIELAVAYKLAPTWEIEISALRSGIDFRAEMPETDSLPVGDADLMVTTAALQYRFFTTRLCHPYVGIGVHVASVSGFAATDDLLASGVTSIEFADSVSITAQIGTGFRLSERIAVDLRATFHDVGTDADLLLDGGTYWRTLRLDIDPWTIAAGIDFRF
jgi:outer membrane protein W